MRLDKETFAGRGRSFVAFISRALVPGLFFVALVCAAQTARAQSSAGSNGMVISQVYTRGGEPGAALRNDFIEFFNRGTSNANLADYSLVISTTWARGDCRRECQLRLCGHHRRARRIPFVPAWE